MLKHLANTKAKIVIKAWHTQMGTDCGVNRDPNHNPWSPLSVLESASKSKIRWKKFTSGKYQKESVEEIHVRRGKQQQRNSHQLGNFIGK